MSANSLLEIAVGSTITPDAGFIVPASWDTTGVRATWELLDEAGILYGSGNALSISESALGPKRKLVNAIASLTIPNSVPVVRRSDKFRLSWLLFNAKDDPISSYIETFAIRPATVHPFGVPDIVECTASAMRLVAVLPSIEDATVTVYQGNFPLYSTPVEPSTIPVYEGNLYEVEVQNTYDLGIRESVVPYTVVWEYKDRVTGERITEDGALYHVNPSILSAARELQNLVHRVRNQVRLEETQIDLNVCLAFLKMGMDYFNGMGQPTYFTMQNATGAVRAHWMQASQVLLLRSQYLVEAERSFTMQGQSVQLEFDITSHYETMASNAQSFLDSQTPDFKKNLLRRGLGQGPGNIESAVGMAVGGVAIALSPVSNFFWTRYPRFKGW